MSLIASMIDTSLNDTREHLGTLSKAKDGPYVLDDAAIDRVEQAHTEQMNCVEIYTRQISRWRNEKPSAATSSEKGRITTRIASRWPTGSGPNAATRARGLFSISPADTASGHPIPGFTP